MKRLSILLVLVTLMGINAFAQTARTAQIKTNLGKAKPSMMGSSQRIEDCDTFVNLCVDDELVLYSTTGGYVCGQNEYGDVSKADIFYLPGTTIKGVLLYFGFAKAANTVDKVKVRVWDNDGTFADGNPGAPGTILSEKLVSYQTISDDVNIDADLTYVQFNSPVAIPADSLFYIGINFGYKKNDTVALVSTLDRTGLSCEGLVTSVDQFSDNSWHVFSEYPGDWGLYVSQMILPIVCHELCTMDITPGNPSVCQNKTKTITASGASTYTWAPADGLNVTTGAVVVATGSVTTTYTVTGDGGECSKTVTLTVKPKPVANFSIGPCVSGKKLLTYTGTPNTGVTFNWYKDGVKIAGQTNSTYNSTTTAKYKVRVTVTETNCIDVKEKQVTNDCKEGLTEIFTAEAYPNPFNQSFVINMASGSNELANVRLVDLSGRTLHEYTGVDTSAPFEINESLSAGVYFVRVSQGTTEKMIKVIKE
ncbi:MAG: T9SS type A sorting domain-containing protein [Chitinophagaceae bacterium]|nr:T9SS type A sorting domain-containing protein [Chitinophagaceae bacterium]